MKKLDNKVALVTGAASGIGRATALRFAKEGARVLLADIDESGLADAVANIEQSGGQATAQVFDACSEADCCAIVKTAVDTWGKLDVVANIAGIAGFWRLEEINADAWSRSIAINLTAPMVISREALPQLIETQGNIVNMASTAGLGGQAYNSMYAATKHGLVGMTKSLALELADKNVRVNAICPGAVKTALNQKLRWTNDMDDKLIQRLSPVLDHMADPDEIAVLATYLASDDARFVTGADMAIDGGQTA